MDQTCSIGIFDSGYGGLTVFRSIAEKLPQYNYIYLGDNARSPYGDHSFNTVHDYTLQCVDWLFNKGCRLVILACNTASAKALRTIQQKDLPATFPDHRVLGVIRPTAECIGNYTNSGKVGVMGTRGTINSGSYPIEIKKFFPDITVYQQSCPLWVPLIEHDEHESPGADYFIKKYVDALLQQDSSIDAILLGCTHYPLLTSKIRSFLNDKISLITQGEIVADSLANYLQRHDEIEKCLIKAENKLFYTTGDNISFDKHGSVFFGEEIHSEKVSVG
ncbi:MAG: glutamate racemase [Pedobacter sp.]|nr:MAG: glutamate racemase [Pedobacter sp.]